MMVANCAYSSVLSQAKTPDKADTATKPSPSVSRLSKALKSSIRATHILSNPQSSNDPLSNAVAGTFTKPLSVLLTPDIPTTSLSLHMVTGAAKSDILTLTVSLRELPQPSKAV